ncbi:hypothetical protein L1987_01605 [Smallanthus sonchifolius]|uniref:Uncharacterized protein n=1 Tax=Smallanthus sonchifolius TaxID=185202 RepID=A0ACB9K5K8_9ASTR|nr:hypothetical protein L1987_01605 [Smallanthus sonchifolius]
MTGSSGKEDSEVTKVSRGIYPVVVPMDTDLTNTTVSGGEGEGEQDMGAAVAGVALPMEHMEEIYDPLVTTDVVVFGGIKKTYLLANA